MMKSYLEKTGDKEHPIRLVVLGENGLIKHVIEGTMEFVMDIASEEGWDEFIENEAEFFPYK